jgi:hypothetical protein
MFGNGSAVTGKIRFSIISILQVSTFPILHQEANLKAICYNVIESLK